MVSINTCEAKLNTKEFGTEYEVLSLHQMNPYNVGIQVDPNYKNAKVQIQMYKIDWRSRTKLNDKSLQNMYKIYLLEKLLKFIIKFLLRQLWSFRHLACILFHNVFLLINVDLRILIAVKVTAIVPPAK